MKRRSAEGCHEQNLVLEVLAVKSSFQHVLSVVFYALKVEKKNLIIINIPRETKYHAIFIKTH